jgi:glutamate-1-semialdehyde 2,1-aminomutase
MKRLHAVIGEHGLGAALALPGYPCLFALVCRNAEGRPDDAYRTLMMQEMIRRGILFQGLFYPTWSHQTAEMDALVNAFDASCTVYRQALHKGSCDGLLAGPPAKPVFRATV